MLPRKAIIVVVLVFGLMAAGCSRVDREALKQGSAALKAGNTKVAIDRAKEVLRRSPHNLLGLRLMKKIKSVLYADAQKNYEGKKYKESVEKVEQLLDLDPQNAKAKALRDNAKKYLEFSNAQLAMQKDNPIAALRMLNEALRLDPQFKEAKDLQVEANKQMEIKIANLTTTAEELMKQGDYEKLRDLAQDILAIDAQNKMAADFLREAQAQILTRNKDQNLSMARKFYSEGIYESAKAKAEEVLKVDPECTEAKELVQKAEAELRKPELRLTGISKIKGMVIAHIELPSTREKFLVKEGDTFLGEGDFKVSAIDLDLKAVVLTFTKTGTQQSLTIAGAETNKPAPAPAAPAAPAKGAPPAKGAAAPAPPPAPPKPPLPKPPPKPKFEVPMKK